MKRQALGEILLNMGIIDELRLHSALAQQRQWGGPLGSTLVRQRYCTSDELLAAFGKQLGLPTVNLDQVDLDPALRAVLPRKVAEQCRAVPLRLEGRRGEVLAVAVAAPAPLSALDSVRVVSKKHRIVPHLATDDAVDRALARYYRGEEVSEATEPSGANYYPLDEQLFDTGTFRLRSLRPVFLFGFGDFAKRVSTVLQSRHVPAQICTALEALATTTQDVVCAPLRAIEELLRTGRPAARIVVVAQDGDDVERARQVGARGYVASPVDPELLARALRRCQLAEA